MACDMNGAGCRVCPGMWIAGILLSLLLVQSLFLSGANPMDLPDAPATTTVESR